MIRLGQICYVNAWPVNHFLDTQGLELQIYDLPPSRLNYLMANDLLDLSPVSSLAYAQQSEWYLLPKLSISAKGRVGSVLLFSKLSKLSALHNKNIALPNTSATSNALLRILLEKYEGIKARYVIMPDHLDQMLANASAALLIGNSALMAARSCHQLFCFDLSQEWFRYTGRSITFAVWAVRSNLACHKTLEQLSQRLLRAKIQGTSMITQLAQLAACKLGGETQDWEHYFRNLRFDLGLEELAGLQLFYQDAYQLGLLKDQPNLRFWSDQAV